MNGYISFGIGRAVVACIVGALVMGLTHAHVMGQGTVDVTGAWTFEVTTSAGSGTPTITLKQDGESVTGTYDGQLGKANLKGTIKGTAITFSFVGDAQGQSVTVVYAGTAANDSLKGTVDLGGLASGTFTAKRQ